MQSTFSGKGGFRLSALSIRGTILTSSSLLLLVIVSSSLYNYYSHGKVIEQQERLVTHHIQLLHSLQTISSQVVLTELESRSFIQSGQEESEESRLEIWQEKIHPAIRQLEAFTQYESSNDLEIKKLAADLLSYEQLQSALQQEAFLAKAGPADSTGTQHQQSAAASIANQKQQSAFNAIKAATARLYAQEREFIDQQSEQLLEWRHSQQQRSMGLIIGSIVLTGIICYWL